MNDKTTTLMGGRSVRVQFADGREEEIQVRQLPLGLYEKAFGCMEDEMALVALICGRDKSWITGRAPDGSDGLMPSCYEAVQLVAREVNASGFFGWAARRTEQVRQTMLNNAAIMAALPPEAMKLAVEMGAISRTSLPKPAPSPR